MYFSVISVSPCLDFSDSAEFAVAEAGEGQATQGHARRLGDEDEIQVVRVREVRAEEKIINCCQRPGVRRAAEVGIVQHGVVSRGGGRVRVAQVKCATANTDTDDLQVEQGD